LKNNHYETADEERQLSSIVTDWNL